MLVTNYVRDGALSHKSAALRCDRCGATTKPIAVDAARDTDEWDRLHMPAKGWTRPIEGRMQRDLCKACSRKAGVA